MESKQNETFFENLVRKLGQGVEKYKPYNKSWKQYFLMITYYKDILKREYNFEYTTGDPSLILSKLQLLSRFKNAEFNTNNKKFEAPSGDSYYSKINQHEILGQGGFGTVFADRKDKNIAYKLSFSKDTCEKSFKEAEIQNHCANKINNLLKPLNVKIPEIYGYSKTSCEFCSISYECVIAMERVPFFNKNIRVGYQLGMGVELKKEHEADDGVIVYTHLGKSRGMFIREEDLISLSKTYNFSWEYLCQSWGFSVAALLFICKNDLNDLEYLISNSKKENHVILYIVDFGLSVEITGEITEITEQVIDEIFNQHLNIDIILPFKNNLSVYPEFINGIKMFASIFPSYYALCNYLIKKFDER